MKIGDKIHYRRFRSRLLGSARGFHSHNWEEILDGIVTKIGKKRIQIETEGRLAWVKQENISKDSEK